MRSIKNEILCQLQGNQEFAGPHKHTPSQIMIVTTKLATETTRK